MRIHSFFEDRDLLTEFVRFGPRHYRDDPRWIPPMEETLRAQLVRRQWDPGDPPGRHFLAQRGGRVVGRLSARVNPELRAGAEPVATIGHFECENDPPVAAALFDTAREWLQARHGIRRVWGPMDGDIWHGYRLMTRGFDQKIFAGEPYNKPYYGELFSHYGWEEIAAWESVELAVPRDLEPVLRWGDPLLSRAESEGYRFEPLDRRRWSEEAARVHPLLSDCFSDFVGFTPISLEDFRRDFSRLVPALPPEWFCFVRGPEGDLVGFVGALLDLSCALRAMRGRSHLPARLRFAWRRRRADRALFYLVGLHPKEPGRGSGLGAAAVRHVLGKVRRSGVRSLVAALMPSDGRSRTLVGDRGQVEAQRRYALFEVRS